MFQRRSQRVEKSYAEKIKKSFAEISEAMHRHSD
jgi:hypothetical protein